MSDLASVRVIVHGRVHGVFFRAFASGHARELGLRGYVRNLPDGTVEVYAEGERRQLATLIEHLKVGPPAARMEEMEVHWSDYTGKYSHFAVLPSEV